MLTSRRLLKSLTDNFYSPSFREMASLYTSLKVCTIYMFKIISKCARMGICPPKYLRLLAFHKAISCHHCCLHYFLADLSAELENTGCFTIFNADDLAIGSTELDNVKNAMFVLEKYCQRNSLKVNVGKTKVVNTEMAEGWPGPNNFFSTTQKSNSRIRLNT